MKRLIAMILVCCLLMIAIPSAATEPDTAIPSAESILSDYYQKAMATQVYGKASATSRSGDGSTSLEEETINILKSVGYEAYFITANNYDAMESTLNTDLATLGLDPSGAYIVAIGTTESNSTGNPNNRAGGQIDQEAGGGDGGVNTEFTLPINGVNYTMRDITVVSSPGVDFQYRSTINLTEIMGMCTYSGDILDMLYTIKVTAECPVSPVSIEKAFLPTWAENAFYSAARFSDWKIVFETYWTRQYIQVWDAEHVRWHTGQYSCRANTTVNLESGYVFNKKIKETSAIPGTVITASHYSEFYQSGLSVRCARAVQGMLDDTTYADSTGDISFDFINASGTELVPNGALFSFKEPLGYCLPTYEYPY